MKYAKSSYCYKKIKFPLIVIDKIEFIHNFAIFKVYQITQQN